MRDLIMVSSQKFNLEQKKDDISNIVDKFCNYLEYFPVKSRPSKYEIMGPVAKILEMAKNKKRYTTASIKSKALRKHEMNKISGFISSDTFEKLETAIQALIDFRDKIPEMQISRVMETIDGEIYFAERKKNVDRFETIKNEFQQFLSQNYKTDLNTLNKKWNKEYKEWSKIPFPSNKLKKENDSIKQDIEKFNENIKRRISNDR